MNMKRNGDWMEWTIHEEWTNIPLQELLKTTLRAPRALLHQWRMNKQVKVNDENPNWVKPLQLGDKLSIELFDKETDPVICEKRPIDILYEDDHVIILNKPIQMNTHPNEEGETGTLANALAYYYEANGKRIKARHVHRLDKDTSGAVVFAKHSLAHSILNQELIERKMKRTYVAIVHGKMKKKSGTINASIGRDRHHPVRRRVSKGGQHAITHYEGINYCNELDCTVVKLTLDTGRTHQIRVHLSSIGHPIIGDNLYGGKNVHINRQALHAENVTFNHPITGDKLEIHAPFPNDIKSILSKC